jgi:hypothetical protein
MRRGQDQAGDPVAIDIDRRARLREIAAEGLAIQRRQRQARGQAADSLSRFARKNRTTG